jgi:lipoprotein NlpI
MRGLAWHARRDEDRAITDYTESIRLKPESQAYQNRGYALFFKGDIDRAFADFDEALRLSPEDPGPYNARGDAWYRLGKIDRALADFNEAIRVNPENGMNHRWPGLVYFYVGRYHEAAAEFEEAAKLNPEDAYHVIWRYLAMARSTGAETAQLEFIENSARFDRTAWPAPIIELLSSRLDAGAVLAAAESPESWTRRDQLCEANFYVAEWHILNQRPTQARPLLEAAIAECPAKYLETTAAPVELARLTN